MTEACFCKKRNLVGMKRHEAFQAEKPMVTGFQKHSERKKKHKSISKSRVRVNGELTL